MVWDFYHDQATLCFFCNSSVNRNLRLPRCLCLKDRLTHSIKTTDGTASHLEHKHIDLGGRKREDPAPVHLTKITRSWKSLMNADFLWLSLKMKFSYIEDIPTPCYVVDTGRLEQNARTIHHVQEETGAKVILALKGFAMFSVFGALKKYLFGTTASSVHEARLGREEFGGEVHAYAPAYSDATSGTPSHGGSYYIQFLLSWNATSR